MNNEKIIKNFFNLHLILFAILLTAGIIVSYFTNFISTNLIKNLKISDYGDFFDVLRFIENKNPYQDAQIHGNIANYPPLGYALMYPFYLLVSCGGKDISINNPLGLVSLILFFAIYLIPILISIYKKTPHNKGLVLSIIIFSFPLYFEIGRGNINLIVLLFLFYFILWHKEESKIKRELSLVFLAIAGAVKLYPIILAVLLLRERRIKDLIRTAFYFTILLFLPFLFFKNGFGNITLFIQELKNFIIFDQTVYYNPFDLSTSKFIRSVFHLIGISGNIPIIFGRIFCYSLSTLAINAVLFTKNNFKATLLAVLILITFPENNYAYAYIYLFIPFLTLLNDAEINTERKNDFLFYLLILMIIFSLAQLFMFGNIVLLFLLAIYMIKKSYYKKYFISIISFISIFTVYSVVIGIYLTVKSNTLFNNFFNYVAQISFHLPLLIMELILIYEGLVLGLSVLKDKNKKKEKKHAPCI